MGTARQLDHGALLEEARSLWCQGDADKAIRLARYLTTPRPAAMAAPALCEPITQPSPPR